MAKLFFANLLLLANDDSIQAQIYSKVTGLPYDVMERNRAMHDQNDHMYGKGRWIEPAVLETFMTSVRSTTLLDIAKKALQKIDCYQEQASRKRKLDSEGLFSSVQRMVISDKFFRYLQQNFLGLASNEEVWTPALGLVLDSSWANRCEDFFLLNYSLQYHYIRLMPRSIMQFEHCLFLRVHGAYLRGERDIKLLTIAIQSSRIGNRTDDNLLNYLYRYIRFRFHEIGNDEDEKIIKYLITLDGYYGLKHLGKLYNHIDGITYRRNYTVVMSAIKSDGRAIRYADAKLVRDHPELMETAIRQQFPIESMGRQMTTFAQMLEFMPHKSTNEGSDDEISDDETEDE
jgi:hypothetical protein